MDIFTQSPPQLGNQFDADRVLTAFLGRHLPAPMRDASWPRLRALGELAAGELWRRQLAERTVEPELIQWDPWGRRIDSIEVTPMWRDCHALAASHGLVATAYESEFQPYARVVQFALVYLFHPASDVYTCPLAMTDGAARALLAAGNPELIERALGRLTSRDPERFWTSGQWMTETAGGSDVRGTRTVARQRPDGTWRLYGHKWFTSAATAEMALTLARVETGGGERGPLALFYLEPRDRDGRFQGIRVLRLKDKLGTRKLPTAELELDGTPAIPVHGLDHGVRLIAPMLNITRTWNSVCAIATMRRSVALARDYAGRRIAFGRRLEELPLHAATLARMQAEFEAAFQLTFHQVRLLARAENDRLDDAGGALLRLLTPLAKLYTGKHAVALVSEALESIGGAGYLEDTGLPALLRDAQVLPIWEGTTNVLALDVLRALSDQAAGSAYLGEVDALLAAAADPRLEPALRRARALRGEVAARLEAMAGTSEDARQAGARDLALAMARLLALALLLEDAMHGLEVRADPRPAAAALNFAGGSMAPAAATDPASDRLLAVDVLEQPNRTPATVRCD